MRIVLRAPRGRVLPAVSAQRRVRSATLPQTHHHRRLRETARRGSTISPAMRAPGPDRIEVARQMDRGRWLPRYALARLALRSCDYRGAGAAAHVSRLAKAHFELGAHGRAATAEESLRRPRPRRYQDCVEDSSHGACETPGCNDPGRKKHARI